MSQTQRSHSTFHSQWLRAWPGVVLGAVVILAIVMGLSFMPTAYAGSGDLDTTFDGDGKVTTPGSGPGNALAVQSDGKLVMVGGSGDFSLARYSDDGSLDTTFGTGGKTVTDFGGSDRANAVAIQSDGKIVVVGTTDQDFAVARYQATGFLDTSFGGTGMVTTNSFGTAEGRAVAIQSDGKIVVAGSIKQSSIRKFALVRYNSDGTLDTTFDGDGFVTVQFDPGANSDEEIKAIVIQSDGKIVAVGEYKSGSFALARYTSAGALDTSFSTDGKVDLNLVVTGYGVAIQTDGKIIVASSKHVTEPTSDNCVDSSGHHCQYKDFWLARYNSDGTLDSTFGTGGEVTTPINSRGNDDDGRAVAIHASGKILVAGYSDMTVHTFTNSGNDQQGSVTTDFAVAQYTPTGALDMTFSGDGIAFAAFFQTCGSNQCAMNEQAYAAVIQADGKSVVAGTTDLSSSSTRHFALARFEAEAPGVPTAYVVNSNADSDDGACDPFGTGSGSQDCTLREAMNAANANIAADTITFDQTVFASFADITLGASLPAINDDVTIDGTVNTSILGVSVLGANLYQILTINSGKTVTLNQIYILGGAGSDGAGIFNNGGTLNATKISVGGNNATGNGGGLYNVGGTVNVDLSQFYGNGASSGGAIKNTGTLSVTNSYIGANSAQIGGGIDNSGVMSLTNSTVYSNTAYGPGGLGGGIINYFGTLSVVNSTISDNNAYTPGFPTNGLGGGIDNGGTLTLQNSIIANSINGGDCAADGGTVTGSNNLIEDATLACGFTNGVDGNIVGVDPNLGAPAYNGGQTQNMALLGGSPALDAGSDAICAAAPVNGLDQRGIARPQGAHCDIGSFEAASGSPTATPTVTPTITPTPTSTSTATATATPAANITVNTFTDEDVDNGSCSLREAIIAANTDAAYRGCPAGSGADVIGVPAGTYTLNDQLPNVTTDITINGNSANDTKVQADANPNVATYRILEVSGSGNLTINHLTFQNGNCPNALSCTGPNSDSDKGKGGAIFSAGILTVNDSTFHQNSSANNGGGIYLNQGTLTVLRTAFHHNAAGGNGGGIGTGGSGSISVTDSTFTSNTSIGGGGMFTGNTSASVTGSTFTGNSGGSSGGGIGASNLSVTLSTFQNNTAGTGAGLYNSYGGGNLSQVANSTFSGNTATSKGGGMYNDGNLTVTNSTFSMNSAPTGGGFYNDPYKRDVDKTYPVVNLKNTILANSTNGGDCYNYVNGTIHPVLGNNNLIETDGAGNNACGTTAPINNSDPLLGTLTGSPQYYPLLTGSPAIDAGNNADCAASPVSNASQNGVTRPQGSHCDIGSFEAATPVAVLEVNHTTGAPNSFFTFQASGFPANATATIFINNVQLTTVQTNGTGLLTFTIDTSKLSTGTYEVRVEVNPTATITFTIDSNAPLRANESGAPVFIAPPEAAARYKLYLPQTQR